MLNNDRKIKYNIITYPIKKTFGTPGRDLKSIIFVFVDRMGGSRSVEILSIHIVHIDTASFAMLRKKQENQVVFL